MAVQKGRKIVKAFNPAHLALLNPHNPGIIGAVPAKKTNRRRRKVNNPNVWLTVEAALFAILGASATRFISALATSMSPVKVTGIGLAVGEAVIGFGLGYAVEHFKVLNSDNAKYLASGGVGVGITHAADTLMGSIGGFSMNTAPVKEAAPLSGVWQDEAGNYFDGYGNMLNDIVSNPYFTEHDFYGTTSSLGDIVAVPQGVIEGF